MDWWRSASRLGAGARWYAGTVLIGLALAWVALSLSVLGLRRTAALLSYGARPAARPNREMAGAREGRRLARRVGAVAAMMPGQPRCLTRALVLRTVLSRRGVPAVLRLGVHRSAPFAAHAWVEVDGVAVSETGEPDTGYLPFERSGPA